MTDDERYALCESLARRIVGILMEHPNYSFNDSIITSDVLSEFSIPDSSNSRQALSSERHQA